VDGNFPCQKQASSSSTPTVILPLFGAFIEVQVTIEISQDTTPYFVEQSKLSTAARNKKHHLVLSDSH
jgi:hypothetical protein